MAMDLNVNDQLRKYVGRAKRRLANLKHDIKKDLNSEEEQQDFLEEEETLDEDVPEIMLSQLMPIIKLLVFNNNTLLYLENAKHKSHNFSIAEKLVYSLIFNTLKKFLAQKKKQYHIIAYQIYLHILTNEVLTYARYAKLIRVIYPPAFVLSSSALHLD
ncbi:hypothetical protein J3Q64DRAFT_1696497 [Phycomyces blakesleeanus]|uniref:Uncharacterized protein n=1 Tax=Phycomyces blakesleeanus TaxID=4837 RepID=A0ABR3B4Z4_PHYBL